MQTGHSRTDLLALAVVLLLLLGGGFSVEPDDYKAKWGLGLLAVCALAFAAQPYLRARRTPVELLEVSSWGIRRTLGPQINEATSWDDLVKVEIVTTANGPAAEDVFFMLHAKDGSGVMVPHSLALKNKLLDALQTRLQGFDNHALIEAMGCTEDRKFLVWTKPTS
jgi:hypothetical protein